MEEDHRCYKKAMHPKYYAEVLATAGEAAAGEKEEEEQEEEQQEDTEDSGGESGGVYGVWGEGRG